MDKKLFIPVILALLFVGGLFYWTTQADIEGTEVVVTDPTPSEDMDTTTPEADMPDDLIDDEGRVDTQGYIDISPAETADLIDMLDNLLIIDVSPDYAQGHLPNSVNYYAGDGSLDTAIPSMDVDRPSLVYCHSDGPAIAGAQALVDAGFTMVYRLDGNYSAWVDAGYPVISDLSLEPSVLQAGFADVSGGTGSGIAYTVRSASSLSHQVMAQLPDLPFGQAYEGWLVDPDTNDFFSTGIMTQTPEGDWLLEYVSDRASDGYDLVVITLEADVDDTPETHILEGTVS